MAMRVNISLLDPDVERALEQYFAADERLNYAETPDEIDAAIYEKMAAEKRLKRAKQGCRS